MKDKYVITIIIGLFLGLILTIIAVRNGDVYTQYQIECEQAEEGYYSDLLCGHNDIDAKTEYNEKLDRAYQKYQVNKHWLAIKKKHKPTNTPNRDRYHSYLFNEFESDSIINTFTVHDTVKFIWSDGDTIWMTGGIRIDI